MSEASPGVPGPAVLESKKSTPDGRSDAGPTWPTAADAAELDVLIHGLVSDFHEHRRTCPACSQDPCLELAAHQEHRSACNICRGHAPLTFGATCPERQRFLREHDNCVRCDPCPRLQTAIALVVDWWEARLLLSWARALRARQDELDEVAA